MLASTLWRGKGSWSNIACGGRGLGQMVEHVVVEGSGVTLVVEGGGTVVDHACDGGGGAVDCGGGGGPVGGHLLLVGGGNGP